MILAPEYCPCPISETGPSVVNSPICHGIIAFMVTLEGFLRGRCNISSPCDNPSFREELPDDCEYDFIVVGAGAAGPIIASTLAQCCSFKVLLLEAGGPDPVAARVPSFYRAFWGNEEVDWKYRTVPGNYCLDQGGKGCKWPRGKVYGGCTVLNGMMYHRGHAADYDEWVAAGAKGWSWEENLPYFYMIEGNRQIGSLVSSKYHSDRGPMPIQQFNYQSEAVHILMDAINETGYTIIRDMNDPNTPAGFGIAQAFTANGQRYSVPRVYLNRKRPNLDVMLNAHVTKVIFKGKRAIGVEYINKKGEKKSIRASKEVILSAGALNTPQILLLSGIGPRATLESYNITVLANLPVGQYLKNHIGVTFNFLLTNVKNVQALDWSVAVKYLLNRKGPMSAPGITQCTGLLYSSLADKNRKQPDLQFFFNGLYAECSRTGIVDEKGPCPAGLNVSVNTVALLPRSVGYMTLQSSDPRDPPLFDPRYFTDPDDMVMVKDGARHIKRIFESKILQNNFGIELDPASTAQCDKSANRWTDNWLECMIRYGTDPQNHQVGTAAIGKVVDPNLVVYDVEGLRVIDASVMPTLPTGNPQAAIMMVALRGAQQIMKDYKNYRSTAKV